MFPQMLVVSAGGRNYLGPGVFMVLPEVRGWSSSDPFSN